MRTLPFLTALCLAAALLFAATAAAADSMFYTDDGLNAIATRSLDGTIPPSTFGGAVANEPYGTAIDSKTGRVYFANTGSNDIVWVDLTTHATGTLDTAGSEIDGPEGLAIEPAEERVYWADINSDKISWAALDGSGGGVLNTAGAPIQEPAGVVVYPAEGRIYWSSYGDSLIGWANLDGSGGGELQVPESLLEGPAGLAIDAAGGRIFWVNWDSGSIAWSDIDTGLGGEFNIGGLRQAEASGIAYDPESHRLYWGNEAGGFIGLYEVGGREVGEYAAGGGSPAFPVLLKAPISSGEPTVSGAGQVGTTLDCASAGWEPDLVESFLYRAPQSTGFEWTRDGAPIEGATGSTLTPSGPGSYACEAIATNDAGTSRAASPAVLVTAKPPAEVAGTPTVTVAGPPPPAAPLPPSPTVRIANVRLDRRTGTATIVASVSGPGTVELTGKGIVTRRAVAGTAGTVQLRAQAKGGTRRDLIERAKAKVALTVTFTPAAGTPTSAKRTVTLVRGLAGSGKEHRRHQS